MPRGELRCFALNKTVAAPGGGNNQEVIIDIDLPVNFTYALTDFQVLLANDTVGATNNFPSSASLLLSNSATESTRTIDVRMEAMSHNTVLSGGKQQKVFSPVTTYKGLLSSESGNQISAIWKTYNATANDVAYAVYINARFLVFDVSQTLHWGVNTPTVVR